MNPVRIAIAPPVADHATPPEIVVIPPKPFSVSSVGSSSVGVVIPPPLIITLPPVPPSRTLVPIPDPATKFKAPPRALAAPALMLIEPAAEGEPPFPACMSILPADALDPYDAPVRRTTLPG